MKDKRAPMVTSCLIGAGLLALAAYVSAEQNLFAAEPPADPAHAAHVAAGAMPNASMVDPALLQQLSELKAKVAQLEAALAGNVARPPVATAPAAGAMPGIAGPAAPMAGAGGMGMGMMEVDMGEMSPMQPGQAAPAAGGMGAMAGGASPPGIDAAMMARLDKMIGMMDMTVRMMDRTVGMMDRMTGGKGGSSMPPAQTAPAAAGMGMMDDDQMEMGGMGGGSMQPGQAAPPMGDMK